MSEEARRRIRECKEKQAISLDLRHCRINDLNDIPELFECRYLASLGLSSNQINDIRPLEKLSNLQSLILYDNKINDIRPLEKLSNLQSLILSFNKISDIRPLEKLSNLQSLILSGNQISDIRALEKLSNLQTLYLSNNQISDIRPLEKLSNLQTLYLSNNQISDIRILANLRHLKSLYLSDNQIQHVTLDFSNHFPALSELFLSNNPLKTIPSEVVKGQGTSDNCLSDLKNYLQDLENGKIKNNQIKVVFIGNGGVGKTQIAKRLAEQEKFEFDTQHQSTHGIVLSQLSIPCDLFPNNGLQVQFWDFAGQDIYHATHRLFMQTQAVFVLVWDAVSEAASHHHYNGKAYKNEQLLYWLEYAHCFGKNSPILIVQNKVDNPKAKRQRPILPELQKDYKKRYDVRRFLQVSAKTGYGFYALENALSELFEDDEQLQIDLLKELPKSWVELRQKVQEHIGQGAKTMRTSAFKQWCEARGIGKSYPTLLGFLHNTGVFFYREGYFNNEIILNQAWAIEAIYKILDRESPYLEVLEQNEGKLRYKDLCRIWGEHSDAERKLFIDFMLSCELCFERTKDRDYDTPLSQRNFIIPQLLSEKPSYIEECVVHYQLTETHLIPYRFLPPVFMHRFIIKTKAFAQLEDMWRQGIFIQNHPMYAIVEADYVSNTIHIRHTADSQALLEAIVEELEQIEGEGRVKPRQRSPEYDNLEFAENYLKGFQKLTPTTMTHKEYIQQLITKSKLKKAIEEFLHGTTENKQSSLHSSLVLVSARFHSNEEENIQGSLSKENYKIERSRIGKALMHYLEDYEPLPSLSVEISAPPPEGDGTSSSLAFTPQTEVTIPEFFITEMKRQFEDEYKKMQRYNKLLSDMIDAEMRDTYEKELEYAEQNIERIENRYLKKLKRRQPELPEQEIQQLIDDLKQTVLERFDKVDNSLEKLQFSVATVEASIQEQEIENNPEEKAQAEELLAQILERLEKIDIDNKELALAAMKANLSTSAKLKLSLPLIPGILKYESDLISVSSSTPIRSWKDLRKVFLRKKE